MSKLVKYSPQQLTAIEVFAMNPTSTPQQIAAACGVTKRTVNSWFANANFVEAVYERYMEMSGVHLPEVIQSMIEEAKAGNVQAGRLVLEHFGKLENKLKIEVESNFERFMRLDNIGEAEFEISNEEVQAFDKVSKVIGSSNPLPDRNPINDHPKKRTEDENKRIVKATKTAIRKSKEKDYQKRAYETRKRAKDVGLALLGNGRHSKGVRENWTKELERLEIKKFGKICKL